MTHADGQWGILSVAPVTSPDCSRCGLDVALDAEGGRLLKTLSQACVGRYLAIIVAGKVQKAPAVRAALGDKVFITFCPNRNTPETAGKCPHRQRIQRLQAELMK